MSTFVEARVKNKTNVANTTSIKCPRCDKILIFGTGLCFFGPEASIQCRCCGSVYTGKMHFGGAKK